MTEQSNKLLAQSEELLQGLLQKNNAMIPSNRMKANEDPTNDEPLDDHKEISSETDPQDPNVSTTDDQFKELMERAKESSFAFLMNYARALDSKPALPDGIEQI